MISKLPFWGIAARQFLRIVIASASRRPPDPKILPLRRPDATSRVQRSRMTTASLSIVYPAGTWKTAGSGSLRWMFVREYVVSPKRGSV